MSEMTPQMTPLQVATDHQQQAADPARNVYVAANAGSGKTRVLVSRVARLLLADKDLEPGKILCLTYTKAAAAEMQSRLFDMLGKWSIADDKTLSEKLDALDGERKKRSSEKLREARGLFAKALETPEGLKVQTIHAFCERLLRRFPIEAGIAPGYEALDDQERASLLTRIKADIFDRALAAPDGELGAAITFLARDKADSFLDAILIWATHNERAALNWAETGLAPMADYLGIEPDITAERVKRDTLAGIPIEAMRGAAHELASSGVANQKIAAKIYAVLENINAATAFDAYLDIFLTQARSPRSKVANSGIATDLLGTNKDGYGVEARRIFSAYERYLSALVFEQSRAIFHIATLAAKFYKRAKTRLRRMDFNDQIAMARDLLQNTQAREWVLYKLDQGVDHILIDEAQDTAPEQWDIVDAVSAEFIHSPDKPRTKFAVGDEKQSIYSFQGAKPELFLDRIQGEIARLEQTKNVSLTMSFRSSQNVLRAVDAVFSDAGAVREIFDRPPAGDAARHQAHREDLGRVELWPVAPAPEKSEDEQAWDFTAETMAPVDGLSRLSARERLARTIAQTIKTWLDTGEAVTDRKTGEPRPIRPGDIMILVKKRSDFFNAVIRNLKLAGVAVAGADRLTLTDNIGVQDLISLGRFIALPSDDLSLAEVLKSPLFGLSDDHLFTLAYKREATLWESLLKAQAPVFLEAKNLLRTIMGFAPGLAPYEFYARVLATLMPEQSGVDRPRESVLRRIYSRLGLEAADPIALFLSRALAHQRSGPPALDRFLRDMIDDDNLVKREAESAANEVRVMTVHGAKGLEAPVVILPDTTDGPISAARGLTLDKIDAGGFVLRPAAKYAPQSLSPLIARDEDAQKQESLRLLYVAMTRAESRLIICGYQFRGKDCVPESWYDWAQRGFNHLPEDQIKKDPHDFGTALCFGPSLITARDGGERQEHKSLPEWTSKPADKERSTTRRVTPSHLLAGPDNTLAPAMRSPLDVLKPALDGAGLGRFGRGNLIHKLLEILPEAARDRRANIADSFLTAQPNMTPHLREEIISEVFAVLDHPDFAPLFAPGSRAEVSLAGSAPGLPEGVFINAQIDRLSVTKDAVWIVDYKSNRPPPKRQDDVSPLYIAQLAAYRALARDIYKDRAVHCALLWTDEPRLMVIDDDRLDSFDLNRALRT